MQITGRMLLHLTRFTKVQWPGEDTVTTVLHPVNTTAVCTTPAETELERTGTDYESTHGHSCGATGLFFWFRSVITETSQDSRL